MRLKGSFSQPCPHLRSAYRLKWKAGTEAERCRRPCRKLCASVRFRSFGERGSRHPLSHRLLCQSRNYWVYESAIPATVGTGLVDSENQRVVKRAARCIGELLSLQCNQGKDDICCKNKYSKQKVQNVLWKMTLRLLKHKTWSGLNFIPWCASVSLTVHQHIATYWSGMKTIRLLKHTKAYHDSYNSISTNRSINYIETIFFGLKIYRLFIYSHFSYFLL